MEWISAYRNIKVLLIVIPMACFILITLLCIGYIVSGAVQDKWREILKGWRE